MKKIYLVRVAFGSYDSYSEEIIKCFENKQDAESYCVKYDRVIREVSNFCANAWSVISRSNYTEGEDLSNCIHHSIWGKYNLSFGDYNGVNVIEMPFIEHRRKTNLKELLD